MEDTFGMIFTRITHINFEEITEFMNTTNYTIEQYNVLKEKVKLAKDSINGYKRSCTDDSKILLVICDRILELCIPICVNGASKRTATAKEKMKEMQEIAKSYQKGGDAIE